MSELRTIKAETQLAMAEAIRAKTGKSGSMTTEDMVEAIQGIQTGESLTADQPTTPGQWACLARASQMRDIKFTPLSDMPMDKDSDILRGGVETEGIWYSSVRGTDWGFIGYPISMYSLLTALHNPRAIIYTRKYSNYFANDTDGNKDGVANVYGTNCSEYVSYCYDLPYFTTTGKLPNLSVMVNERGEHDYTNGGVCWDSEAGAIDLDALRTELKLCDVLNSSGVYGENHVHAVLVTAIKRDSNNLVQRVGISESYWGQIRYTEYTWDEFVNEFTVNHGYNVYRYANLDKVTFPENLSGIVYSDLCTSRGDKVSIRPDQDIELNIVSNADQYKGIVLLKDGVYHSHTEYKVDWLLIDPYTDSYPLTTGKYTAILYKSGDTPTAMTEADATATNSTRFIACNVSVNYSGGIYKYKAEAVGGVYPTPMQITLKGNTGLTTQVREITGSYIDGEGQEVFSASGSPFMIHVPFKTEYGFVIAEAAFDASNNPIVKPTLVPIPARPDITPPEEEEPEEPAVPDDIQFVEYISYTDRLCYIDTEINMKEYSDTPLNYHFEGVINKTSTEGLPHFWGARYVEGTENRYAGCCYCNVGSSLLALHMGVWSNASNNVLQGKISESVDNWLSIDATNMCPSKGTGNLFLDDVAVTGLAEFSPRDIKSDVNMFLLAENVVGGVIVGRHIGKSRRFVVEIANTKEIIADFRSAYSKSSGAIGVYDMVSRKLFTTPEGSFGKGADVSADYFK